MVPTNSFTMSLPDKGLVHVRVAPTKLLVICIYTGAHIRWNSCHLTATYRVSIMEQSLIHSSTQCVPHLCMFSLIGKLHEDDNKNFLDMFKNDSYYYFALIEWLILDNSGQYDLTLFNTDKTITFVFNVSTYIMSRITVRPIGYSAMLVRMSVSILFLLVLWLYTYIYIADLRQFYLSLHHNGIWNPDIILTSYTIIHIYLQDIYNCW